MSAGPPPYGDPTLSTPATGPGYPGPGPAGPDQRFDRPAYPPAYDQGYGGGGHDRGAEAAAFARRHLRTPETKEFFKTSEFFVWALTFVAVLIAGAVSDNFDSWRVWLFATILSATYMLSRGIAKSGSRRGEPEGRGD
jgi:hypothetical protein